ncbi:hypothetical protein FDP41_009958 [Naegleria fowleri]|uniref:Uncharacterized protein n=1 Tax=Naegleria fowleri TaxID=5763 RepID=A0A6A5BC71_NAEFO|nr:uncharacterized protein FDP41_009958 [Naegleria fowleri]KAF0971735.1 hypothetical protein FDP41_009958 [Naegleria fowleri]
MDRRGIIYLAKGNGKQIYVICSESGQILDKMGYNCRRPFPTKFNLFFSLSLDRNDNLMISCYDENHRPAIKVFTRNLHFVKSIRLPLYNRNAIIYDSISDGCLLQTEDAWFYLSKDFDVISQKTIWDKHGSFSNGVLYCVENATITCYK